MSVSQSTNQSETGQDQHEGQDSGPILDHEIIRYERSQQLRRSHSAAKGVVTKRIKELTELITSVIDASEARIKDQEFHDVAVKLYRAHADYHATITDEYDLQDSEEYFHIETQRIEAFKRTLTDWIDGLSNPNPSPMDCEINSKDSISNVGSKARSRWSAKGSTASSRRSRVSSSAQSAIAAAKAKKAMLTVRAEALDKYKALEEEELRVQHEIAALTQRQEEQRLRCQQRKKELEIETEFAKADAEEKAYAETLLRDKPQPMTSNGLAIETGLQGSQTPTQVKPSIHSVKLKGEAKEDDASDDSETAGNFLREMVNVQQLQLNQNQQMFESQRYRDEYMQQLLNQQHRLATSMALPNVQVPTFSGNPIEYCHFIRSFETLVEDKMMDSGTRLRYLIQYTSGDVQELMRSCLTMKSEDGYRRARSLLKQRYGQNYRIATAYIDRIVNSPPIKDEDGTALHKFSILITSCKNTLEDIGYKHKLENSDNLQRVVNRLPFSLRRSWRDVADDITSNQSRDITFEDLAKFVEKRARALTHPVFGKIIHEQNPKFKLPKSRLSFGVDGEANSKKADTTVGGASVFNIEVKKYKCPRCNGDHLLSRCEKFKRDTVKERVNLVRRKGLCDNCLFQGHIARVCLKESFCKVTGCQSKHSTYLHPLNTKPDEEDKLRSKRPKNPDHEESDINKITGHNGFVNSEDALSDVNGAGVSQIGLAIVPVKVKSKNSNRTALTYAFLDPGSNTTFCTRELMEELGIEGENTVLSLTTLQSENHSMKSQVLSLEVYDLEENDLVELPTVFSTLTLPINERSIPRQSDIDKWPYLSNVKIIEIDASVGLLIGNDVPKALEPKETIESEGVGPYAVRTICGWTINGPLGRNGSLNRSTNFIRADDVLNEQFKRFCNVEFSDSTFDDKVEMSREDLRAVNILENSAELRGGHYELALPWKNSSPSLPNNRPVAEHRLALLKRRFNKDPKLFSRYAEVMDNLLDKGYATKVPATSMEMREETRWYLPHHPVINPNKPEKLRVVFDCAATYHGTSLNDQLLQGPDLTNGLIGVLIRFRQDRVALMADIESMFHQVHVPDKDRDVLRFLWWPGNDLDARPEEYQMTVHLFGAKSSPTCANFALRKTATDNAEEFSNNVVETIKRNFYVDNCLKSVPDEDEASMLAADLRVILQRGGFRLTKWVSNSPKVVASIPEAERAGSVKDVCPGQPTLERALGVQWNVGLDQFGFRIKMKEKPSTRRGVLSLVSSVYDPLGFGAPFVLIAKMLMQELCRKNLSWDDPIQGEYLKRWESWQTQLMKIEKLYVPRCFKPSEFGKIVSSQLHQFADASERAYGAVSYLRLVNEHGDIHVSFVIGKARLAPLKVVTIPRLELSAAVVATRLDKMVRNEIDFSIDASVFWTDSTTVLGYILNEEKRFKTFVANRVAVIHETTIPSQWKYVSTQLNPADDASRGLSADALLQNKRWLSGPDFLWKTEDHWPSQLYNSATTLQEDPEVKIEPQTFATVAETQEDPLEGIFKRFSSWTRLRIFIAWVLRYKSKLRETVRRRREGQYESLKAGVINPISVEELVRAENEVLKRVQGTSFREELKRLDDKSVNDTTNELKVKYVKKSSSIYNLDPQLIDGILRVGGRLKNAPIPKESKHPIIVPKNNHISNLIVRYYHQISAHAGREHVLSLLRERFWIVGARIMVKRILNNCVECRKIRGPRGEQKMADLPNDRVIPNNPPFSFVGVDCFGPFLVKRGRSLVKRYSVLFTCLTIRAIHIEIAYSLDTDSFLQSMRRFIARRGRPEIMRSDNGTNFVAGEKELRNAIDGWNQEKLHKFLLQQHIKWIFNSPTASHQGGVWERCIRTVRKVLKGLLKQQVLDEEGLTTLMCEAESIVNSRPLTKVSDDPNDAEALTPNHLLLLRSGPSFPPGMFTKEERYSRRRWRQIQYLADVFWRRWVKEYLPTLQKRQKWTKPRRNFQLGDIVLIVDENYPRCSWALGRIIEVKPGRDGYVRRVSMKTKSTVLERPINKIVLLEADVVQKE
ncbi:uncharacterized protein LOC114527371 [Dendronephthya gigantea]|uniref:uncharacterized protein LOC114527371 n=1 Tax=Dendronephthya gigantea TaxID=151771 RepID=UPI00106AA3B9|nr:uncharacterized protein LOC114527371 [Dendronephthya gigantea]